MSKEKRGGKRVLTGGGWPVFIYEVGGPRGRGTAVQKSNLSTHMRRTQLGRIQREEEKLFSSQSSNERTWWREEKNEHSMRRMEREKVGVDTNLCSLGQMRI